MNSPSTPEETAEEQKAPERLSIGRFNSFSDAVFAVAITLLVLSIQTVEIHGTVTEAKVLEGLGAVWPHFFAYALSFVIVGAFWASHHRLFERFHVVDNLLLWMNLFYLMVVVFIPYATGMIAKYGDTITATALYAGCMCLIGLMQALMCWYGARYQVEQGFSIDSPAMKDFLIGSLTMALVFFVSIGIAFWNTNAAQYFWLVLIPLGFIGRAKDPNRGARPAIK